MNPEDAEFAEIDERLAVMSQITSYDSLSSERDVRVWVPATDDGGEESKDVTELVLRVRELHEYVASVGAPIWKSAMLLSRWLLRRGAAELGSLSVADLGSGCGVTGLVAAQLAARCVLTDNHEAVVANLAHNVALNGGRGEVATLDWLAQPPAPELCGAFDLLLAADCVYEPEAARGLAQTLAALARGPEAVAVVVSPAHRRGLPEFEAAMAACGWALAAEGAPPGLMEGLDGHSRAEDEEIRFMSWGRALPDGVDGAGAGAAATAAPDGGAAGQA